MAWYVIPCPKCGELVGPRRTHGEASAAWRVHVVVHMRDRAWVHMNEALDDGVDEEHYRAQWEAWERLVTVLTRIR